MGRPLNKKYFGDGTGLLQATLAFLPGAGSAVACHILRQRSNLKYEVANEATVASTALVVGAKYIIVTVGGADYTTVGAADNNVGTRFTATGTSAGGAGTAREFAVCKLQAATPTADFQMHIEVQGENAQVPTQATIDITQTAGVIDSVAINNAGYGYWADATGVAVPGGTGGTVDYTVDGNGSVATVVINAGGTGYSNSTQNLGTADANPPLQYARIINSRLVKTFEGSTFAWPAAGGDASGGRAQFTEGDIDTQA